METVGQKLNIAWGLLSTHILSKSSDGWADVIKSVEPRSGVLIGTSILAGLVFARRAYKTSFCLAIKSNYRINFGVTTGELRTYNFKFMYTKIGYIVASVLSFASAGHEASQQGVSKSLEATIQTLSLYLRKPLTESLQEFLSTSNKSIGIIGIALFTGMVFAKKAWSSPLQIDLSFNSVTAGGDLKSKEIVYSFTPIFTKLMYCAFSAGACALAGYEICALLENNPEGGGWI